MTGWRSHRSWLLIPAAVAAWGAALLQPRMPLELSPVLILVALAAAVIAGWAWWRQPSAASVGATVTAVAVALVAVSGVVHLGARDAQPWPELIAARATVTAELRVASPGRVANSGAQWQAARNTQRFTAQIDVLHAGETSWDSASRVSVIASLPSGVAPVRPGDRLAGEFRVSPAIAAPQGMSATLTSTIELGAPTPNSRWTSEVIRRLDHALPNTAAEPANLVLGMTFGDDSGLSEQTSAAMRDSGLTHLTAVSGANIAIVTGAVLLLGRLCGLPMRAATAPALVVLVGYVAVVGPEPSVIRATAMALIALAGLGLGGGGGAAALAGSVIGLLALDPWLAASRGFALSCAATAGLIAMATPGRTLTEDLAARVPKSLRVPVVAVTAAGLTAVAAGVATMPLLAAYGGGISVVSAVANVAAAPLVPVVTVAGIAVAVLAWWAPAVAAAVAIVPVAGATWILDVARWAAAVPGGRLPWPSGLGAALLLCLAIVGLIGVGRRWRWVPVVVPTMVAAASIVAATVPAMVAHAPADWQMVFCDVGQGDAMLLRAGPSAAVLVDAGPEPTSAVDCLGRYDIKEVPAVVLSHFHADHVTGVGAVVAEFAPLTILVSPLAQPSDTYHATMATLSPPEAIDVVVPGMGQEFRIGEVRFTVLGPSRIIDQGSAPNNTSLVLSAAVGSPNRRTTVLLTGDLEPEGQLALMNSVPPMQVDLVKVPHHGSGNQHPRFVLWSRAAMAVVSAGADNDYGHPAPSTMAAWQNAGSQVMRTDESGDIIVVAGPAGTPRVLTRAAATPARS